MRRDGSSAKNRFGIIGTVGAVVGPPAAVVAIDELLAGAAAVVDDDPGAPGAAVGVAWVVELVTAESPMRFPFTDTEQFLQSTDDWNWINIKQIHDKWNKILLVIFRFSNS